MDWFPKSRSGYSVKIEHVDDIAILRHSGTHACTAGDHEQDEWIGKLVEDRLSHGMLRFLLDVRELTVIYGSGMADLLAAWKITSARGIATAGSARFAILWDAGQQKGLRWRFLREFGDCFEGEREALTFLLSDRPIALSRLSERRKGKRGKA